MEITFKSELRPRQILGRDSPGCTIHNNKKYRQTRPTVRSVVT